MRVESYTCNAVVSAVEISYFKANLIGLIINYNPIKNNEIGFVITFNGGYKVWMPKHIFELNFKKG